MAARPHSFLPPFSPIVILQRASFRFRTIDCELGAQVLGNLRCSSSQVSENCELKAAKIMTHIDAPPLVCINPLPDVLYATHHPSFERPFLSFSMPRQLSSFSTSSFQPPSAFVLYSPCHSKASIRRSAGMWSCGS